MLGASGSVSTVLNRVVSACISAVFTEVSDGPVVLVTSATGCQDVPVALIRRLIWGGVLVRVAVDLRKS